MTQTEQHREMNRVIAKFMNYPQSGIESKDPYYYAMKHCYDNDLMKYHSDWGWLHGAWNKVYKIFADIDYTSEKAIHFHFVYSEPMKEAMITGNLTTAHKILYDAIQWLNQQSK